MPGDACTWHLFLRGLLLPGTSFYGDCLYLAPLSTGIAYTWDLFERGLSKAGDAQDWQSPRNEKLLLWFIYITIFQYKLSANVHEKLQCVQLKGFLPKWVSMGLLRLSGLVQE